MSDHQQGPGWWLASDGRWYPPESAPPVPPPESWPTAPQPPSGGGSGSKVWLVVVGVVAAVALLVGAVVVLTADDDDEPTEQADPDSPDDAGADEPATPSGLVPIEGDGVSIAVPEGWVAISAEDLAEGLDLAEAFPDAPPGMLEGGRQAVEQGAVLVAIDSRATDFAASVNVIRAPGEAPLAAIGPPASAQIEQLGGTVTGTGERSLPVGDAVWITYTIDVAMPDGTTKEAAGVQYYVPVDGSTYIVTITSNDDVDALGEAMLQTFEIS